MDPLSSPLLSILSHPHLSRTSAIIVAITVTGASILLPLLFLFAYGKHLVGGPLDKKSKTLFFSSFSSLLLPPPLGWAG